MGVVLSVPQLRRQFSDTIGANGDGAELSGITRDWVNGDGLREIALRYFSNETDTEETRAITEACRTIYRAIANAGAWGVSAIGAVVGKSRRLSDEEQRRLDSLPAMIYHGVRSEEAVLMRMNSVPRSVAVKIGEVYKERQGQDEKAYSIGHAREFLNGMDAATWGRVRPADAALTGDGYRRVWRILSGEGQ